MAFGYNEFCLQSNKRLRGAVVCDGSVVRYEPGSTPILGKMLFYKLFFDYSMIASSLKKRHWEKISTDPLFLGHALPESLVGKNPSFGG